MEQLFWVLEREVWSFRDRDCPQLFPAAHEYTINVVAMTEDSKFFWGVELVDVAEMVVLCWCSIELLLHR